MNARAAALTLTVTLVLASACPRDDAQDAGPDDAGDATDAGDAGDAVDAGAPDASPKDAGVDGGADAGDACGGCEAPTSCAVVDENGESACVCPAGTATCGAAPCAVDTTTTSDCGGCGLTCEPGEACGLPFPQVGVLCSCNAGACSGADDVCVAGACLTAPPFVGTRAFGLYYFFDPGFFQNLVFPVCAGAADDVAARVACAELGTPSDAPVIEALAQRPAEIYGPGIVDVACTGAEARILDCALTFATEPACPDPGVALPCP